MRYDTEHKGRTRERVLKEASAAIRVDGPDRVGVAEIMNRAGLTHGGFYAHFKSKDDLITQAVGYMFDERYAAFFARLDMPDPEAAVSEFIDWYLSPRHAASPQSGCPLPALAAVLQRLPEAAQARFVIGVDKLTDGVRSLLDRLGRPEPEDLARSAIAEMIGALSLARAAHDEGAAHRLLETSRLSIKHRLGIADRRNG